MKRLLLSLCAGLLSLSASAQSLTAPQLATICTACKAAAACNTPRLIGDSVSVLQWLNAARTPTTLAWHVAAPQSAVRRAPNYNNYDSLVAGKRDSWRLFLEDSQDFTVARTRNWVVDVWGAATASSNAEAVLQAGTFSASNAQNALGGTSRTTGTVSALDLVYPFQISQDEANYVADGSRCQ